MIILVSIQTAAGGLDLSTVIANLRAAFAAGATQLSALNLASFYPGAAVAGTSGGFTVQQEPVISNGLPTPAPSIGAVAGQASSVSANSAVIGGAIGGTVAAIVLLILLAVVIVVLTNKSKKARKAQQPAAAAAGAAAPAAAPPTAQGSPDSVETRDVQVTA